MNKGLSICLWKMFHLKYSEEQDCNNINDMCNVSTSLKPILFADDTNVFYFGKDIDELCSVVSIELDKLNKLSLNTSTTNFMVLMNSCDDTYILYA